MNHNSNRICWLFTVLIFHVAVSDRISKIVTSVQAIGKTAEESMAVPAQWFQHWSADPGKNVRGLYATVPGAFKYSVMLDVVQCRCSGAIISAKFVLSSTLCYKKTNKTTKAVQEWRAQAQAQNEVGEGPKPIGWALAGGINYRTEAAIVDENVQVHRLERLLLYTETDDEKDLLQHDTMLASVGAPGFAFNSYVQPIRLTNQRRFYTSQPTTCIVVGFGGDNHETITMANLLQKCPNNGLDNVVCADEYRWPCMGDAGAPLVCRNLLIGTLRMQGLLPNDQCDKSSGAPEPGVQNFTFVGYYRDWIVEHASIKFGVWRSGSPGLCPRAPGCHAAVLVLHIWVYICLK